MELFNIVTEEQKADAKKACESIQQFDLLRQNIGKKVTYTMLDVYGQLYEKEGVLKSVSDFIFIGIDEENIKIFPSGFLPVLLDICREEDGAPLFSLSTPREEAQEKRQQQIREYETMGKRASGYDYYSPFKILSTTLALDTFGGLIPGLKSGKVDILENAYEFSTKTNDILISFGIDPQKINENFNKTVVYRPSRKDIRTQLKELKQVAENIRRGFQEKDYSFGFRYPFENTKDGKREFLLNAIEGKKCSDTMTALVEEIRDYSKNHNVK